MGWLVRLHIDRPCYYPSPERVRPGPKGSNHRDGCRRLHDISSGDVEGVRESGRVKDFRQRLTSPRGRRLGWGWELRRGLWRRGDAEGSVAARGMVGAVVVVMKIGCSQPRKMGTGFARYQEGLESATTHPIGFPSSHHRSW